MFIKQLFYVAALAREQHFGRAAESCDVSQPTLSAGIRQLEAELGVTIVERGQRFNGLTREGQRVLEYANRIIAECTALKQDLGQMSDRLVGRLRLGAIPTAIPSVALVTAAFQDRFPHVTISIYSRASKEIQLGLDRFDLDAGLTYVDNEPLDGVRSVPLYPEGYALLMSDRAFEGRDSVTWEEAAEQPLCLLTPDMQNRRIIDGIFRSVGKEPQPVIETNVVLNLWTYGGLRHGMSIVPDTLLKIIGVPRGAKALPLVKPEVTRSIGLIMAEREPSSPVARAFFAAAAEFDFEAMLARPA